MSKDKVMDPNKEFLAFVKLYFTTLSARKTPCVYFNTLADNSVLLSNTDGELLANFSPGELSFHQLIFKQHFEYIERLKEILLVEKDDVELRNICTWLKYVNKYGLENVVVFKCPTTSAFVVTTVEDADRAYDKNQIIGFTIHDSHLKKVLGVYLKYFYDLSKNEYPSMIMDISLDPIMQDQIIYEEIDVSDIKKDGESIFKGYNRVKIISFDGLSTPALKEFIKKRTSDFYYKRIVYAETNQYIKWINIFENDKIKIISIRPNIGIYPLSNETINAK